MFSKNAKLTFEILPDGKVYVESYIGNNPEKFAELVNKILTREYTQTILDSITKSGRNPEITKYICGQIIDLQNRIEYKLRSVRRRNPLIKPREVFKAYHGE